MTVAQGTWLTDRFDEVTVMHVLHLSRHRRDRRRRGGVLAVLATLLLVVLAPGVSGQAPAGSTPAGDPTASGWVVVRQPTTANYVPAARDRGNSSGGTNRVIRIGKGEWTIRMDLAASAGHVQVSPLNGQLRFCSIDGWDASDPVEISVVCRKRNGLKADTPFVVTFTQLDPVTVAGATDPRIAYLWNDDGSADHEPSGHYQDSWSNLPWTIDYLGSGTYAAKLFAVIDTKGTVQISHYDPEAVTCIIDDWTIGSSTSVAGLPTLTVRFRCRDRSGALVDARSTLLYLHRLGIEGFSGGPAAYVFANQLHRDAPYHPAAERRFVTGGGQATVDRRGLGLYRVTFGGVPSGGAALVTSVGDGTTHCQPSTIRGSGGPLRITVKCFKPNGDLVDGRFTLAWTK